jgi:FHS family L-fucose permease-like MFS transporter
VSYAIFGSVAGTVKVDSLDAVKVPYLILGAAFLIVALIFKFSSLPNKIDTEIPVDDTSSKTKDILDESAIQKATRQLTNIKEKTSAIQYPQLWMGMIAIFLYVGVEVSTASNLPEFMKQHLHTPTNEIAPYVSLFWASLMIGRWTGAVGAMNVTNSAKQLFRFLMPYLAFGIFLVANRIANHDTSSLYLYAAVLLILVAADYFSKGNPARQLLIFSSLGITALCIGMLADGMVSVYAFISVGLFCSTLWPCIFTLAIAGLGKHTNQGSGFLIMMIMGGGFISLFQGVLADEKLLGIQYSYIVGVICFLYLAFYGWKTNDLLKKQGINYDASVAAH